MSELHMGKPICLRGTNIIPIEKVYLSNYPLRKGYWLYRIQGTSIRGRV